MQGASILCWIFYCFPTSFFCIPVVQELFSELEEQLEETLISLVNGDTMDFVLGIASFTEKVTI